MFWCYQKVFASQNILLFLAFLAFRNAVIADKAESSKEPDVKDIAEEWFTKQATGLLGKRFLEKVKCKKFVSHFQETYPNLFEKSNKYSKSEVNSVV